MSLLFAAARRALRGLRRAKAARGIIDLFDRELLEAQPLPMDLVEQSLPPGFPFFAPCFFRENAYFLLV